MLLCQNNLLAFHLFKMLRFALHLPNPMFVFVFEGALLAFIVSGDRFVLFALLPRRKPRTSVSAAAFLSCMSLCHSDCSKNSTSPSAGTPIPACHLAGGMDFVCIVAVAPLPYINPSKRLLGFTDDFRGGRGCAARFRFWRATARCFRRHSLRSFLCLRFLFQDTHTGAEPKVRERARGRAESEQRQR